MQRLVLVTLGLACFIAFSNAAVARAIVKVGKPFSFDFGEGHYVIRRVTKAAEGSQFIFAGPSCSHGWTTDGKHVAAKGARLYWNGTLVINKVTEKDVGEYYRPLEKTDPHLAPTQYVFQLE
ncbi:hypothetical protein AAVH_37703 [Aphelenchoides avenae]|nr:hypothetical protein AAVH_37703 [Aphelenchus avenae]